MSRNGRENAAAPTGNEGLPLAGGQKTLAYLLHDLDGVGTTVQAFTVCAALADRGYRVDLVVVERSGELAERVPENIDVTELLPAARGAPRRSMALASIAASQMLRDYLQKHQPDTLISGSKAANLMAIAAHRRSSTRGKLILTLTNALYHDSDGWDPSRWVSLMLIRKFYRYADRVITLSRGMTDDLVRSEGLPADLFEIIPPPIDTERIARLAREPVDHPWFRAGEPPVVLNVGRLAAQKGHSVLLRAFAAASRKQEMRLVVLGNDADGKRAVLEREATELGIADRVDLLDFDPNPYRYMARAGVFALSSLWEGFGIVVAEAMACGCPIVASDCRYGPREILMDGRFGRLVPPKDVSALAAAISDEIADRECMDAVREAAERFSLSRVTARYDQLVAGLAS